MGPPKGLSRLARATSTWIHWWSSVASAKRFTRCWVTSTQSLVPSSLPLYEGRSARVVVVVVMLGLLGHDVVSAQVGFVDLAGGGLGQGVENPVGPSKRVSRWRRAEHPCRGHRVSETAA